MEVKIDHETIVPTNITTKLKEFKKDAELTLKSEINYNITGIAVSADDKLYLCNFHCSDPKVYSFACVSNKDAINEIGFPSEPFDIAILPGSDRAVVTSPENKSLYFINITSMKISQSINTEDKLYSVEASSNRIFVGSYSMIHVLNHDGSRVATINITNADCICSLFYRKEINQLLCRSVNGLFTVEQNNDVNLIGQVNGQSGLAIDCQGYIYLSQYGSNEIQRLNSECIIHDVVLTKSEGIFQPYCISFNNDCSKLVVVNDCESVVIYTCS